MANIGQINRALENLFGLPPNALDAALGVGQIIRERIEAVGAETGGIVSMPIFSRTENEDVNDWVRQFDVAYTASGKPEGPVGGGVCRQRKANVAITCLKGAALQSLKVELVARFTRDDLRRRKMIELTRVK
ncbi:hypothetical protein RhiirA4_492188 [Rhizophagus irregularis]|uniref:Uncharacterized protein n=1 Tax=Rhizophagus irregularis TaxID=588596 RepID=A0A2I1HX01_9GLOM|nr:hypothetical protein RhiirA4_492188 [Rhizophagus irregularis]